MIDWVDRLRFIGASTVSAQLSCPTFARGLGDCYYTTHHPTMHQLICFYRFFITEHADGDRVDLNVPRDAY
jgi:hypothetical protein